jgi:phosphatidylinositol alpha-1,6-mannosyltransferase
MPRILEDVPEAALLIVGDGPESTRLRELAASLGLDAEVHWAGSIAHREMPGYLHAGDVFAMPNRRMPDGDIEGFGLVFLEANACGKPVIGGRSGGAVDAIADGESGYLVDPESPDEVADRAIGLLRQPDLARRMGETGRRRVLDRFTWPHTGRALARAIEMAGGAVAARA